MFTQAMPAFANSMRNGQMFPAMQALGNCQQPLSHRGGVNFAAGPGLNQRGVYTSQPWNPADYQFPGGSQFADFGGMNVNWNSGNRYDSQFFFPTDQFFTQNQFFGGPQVHIDGRMQVDIVNADTYEGDTVNVNNVTTEVINGDPVAGQPGRPGEAGRDGRPGAPGFPGRPGRDGAIPQGQFAFLPHLRSNGRQPKVVFARQPVQKPHRYVKNAMLAPFVSVGIPTNAISGGSVTISAVEVVVPTGVTFNPSTCEVTFTGTTTVYALSQASASVSISGTAADTAAYVAATTAGTMEAFEDGASNGPGFLLNGAGPDFWGLPDPVEVARDPELRGVVVAAPVPQVFQK